MAYDASRNADLAIPMVMSKYADKIAATKTVLAGLNGGEVREPSSVLRVSMVVAEPLPPAPVPTMPTGSRCPSSLQSGQTAGSFAS